MKGTHRGDFSRVTFDPGDHYSSVRLQQGRVLLDTDWNDQVEIESHRRRTRTADIVGPSGGPTGAAGFELTMSGALEFDGERQYLRIGGSGVTTFSDADACSLELRTRPQAGAGTLLTRFDRLDGEKTFNCRFILALGEDGRLVLYRYGAGLEHLVTNARLIDGQVAHVAVVLGRSTTAIYVDGQGVAKDRQGMSFAAGESFFLAGALLRDGQPQRAYTGQLLELRAWTAELAASALERDLDRAAASDRHGLAGHWRFDRPPVSGQIEDLAAGPKHGNPAILGDGREIFSPTFGFSQLTIGAGRYYIDGLLCENDREVTFEDQPDHPGAVLSRAGIGQLLFYLDAWEHLVTAAEDPALREPALAGADTSTRSRVLAQVKTLQLAPGTPIGNRDRVTRQWLEHVAKGRDRGRLRIRRHPEAAEPLGNFLYRVEIHRPSDPRSAPAATFKWSRDNGSTTYPVHSLTAGDPRVELEDAGGGDLELAVGDWVEISDHRLMLSPGGGSLHQIVQLDTASLEATLEPPPAIDSPPELYPLLRLWNQKGLDGASLDEGGVPIESNRWQRLEAGLEVRFEDDAPYRAGDYWCLVTRAAHGSLEWPRDRTGKPLAVSPDGVDHHLAMLAALDLSNWQLHDYRQIFQPLVNNNDSDGDREDEGDRSEGTHEGSGLITGDGPVAIDGDLEVQGTASATVLRGELGSTASVSTANLCDGAVTEEKLAPGLSGVPSGYSILGTTPEPPSGFVYTGATVASELTSTSWRPIAGPPTAEAGPLRSAVVDGRIYSFLESGDVWELDLSSRQWQSRGTMPEPRRDFAVASLGGRIYVVGGVLTDGTPTGSVEAFDPRQGWSSCSDLPLPRQYLALAVMGGRLYAVGGVTKRLGSPVVCSRADVYNPSVDTWRQLENLPKPAFGMAAAAAAGRVHVFGGASFKRRHRHERHLAPWHWAYHPGHGSWQQHLAPLPGRWFCGAAVAVGRQIYILGGRTVGGASPGCLRYDIAADYWRGDVQREPPLPQAIAKPGAVAVGDRLYALGGDGSAAVSALTVASRYYVHRRE